MSVRCSYLIVGLTINPNLCLNRIAVEVEEKEEEEEEKEEVEEEEEEEKEEEEEEKEEEEEEEKEEEEEEVEEKEEEEVQRMEGLARVQTAHLVEDKANSMYCNRTFCAHSYGLG